MKKWFRSLNLYKKFTITIIMIGLVPMMILSTFIANNMIRDYREAMRSQFEQAAGYVASSLESMLDSYNTISKMPFYYNYSVGDNQIKDYLSFDNLRQILYGIGYDPETMEVQRKSDMENFLKYVMSVDSYITGTHFLAEISEGNRLMFHYSRYSTFFKDEELFKEMVGYTDMDREINKIILIPTHETGYFSGLREPVFTVARNYFDLRGEVGNTPYVGTIFLDVNLQKVEQMFGTVKFNGDEAFYVVNEDGDCFYSSIKEKITLNIAEELSGMQDTEKQLLIETKPNAYGLRVVAVLNTEVAFGKIRNTQRMMYLILAGSLLALIVSSVFFSKRLTHPIHAMMEQMAQVESGNFDIQLPVGSGDEIGILSQRFNQMSEALKKYINQSYVAQIKQSEAELTALKSQIYPHFLYNTLEIIRMTALDDGGNKVPEMIEALSEQIHYLIGPMRDMVPLEKEIDIIQKYIYLLNCRITKQVQLMVDTSKTSQIMVPKLILQPVVENAYVHGIKPKKGNGSIMLEASVQGDVLEICVMDNGIGMDEASLNTMQKLLDGNEPGIKNEYNWQSIGLKNVHDRIRYLYGEEYGIQITSTPEVGTMVRLLILLPEVKEGTYGKNDIGRR